MKKLLVIYLLCILPISACTLFANPEDLAYGLEGSLLNGQKVLIFIESKSIDDNFIYGKPTWWGAEFSLPRTVTTNIKVTLGKNVNWIPFSSFSDLVNVNSAKLVVSQKGFKLTIDGGQSATHYIAHLNFDNDGFLISRKVYSPAFSDEVWEETKYSFIRRDDM